MMLTPSTNLLCKNYICHIDVLVIAGPDTTKGVLISLGAAAVLAVVTFSLTGTAPTPKQASDAATKLKDLNEF